MRNSRARRKQRGRHGAKYTEEQEDADLLKDEAGGAEVGHRLSTQPSVIKHGVLREYQMQGLNWLIHLYDNGINGILADEMARPLRRLPLLPLFHALRAQDMMCDRKAQLAARACPGRRLP
jgi:hypothetical protein